ncbi:myotubularin-related protein 2-like isoform 2 [Thraustotheca clavata]|uniref:Myotubularin-related protein 2-like isoform 2 n=1 Tax=Thraustotheca clavata TaxID=74557 RepID=A0A1V9Y889_9STRA|nr:myotubularin-related protein 2-like isoform 2 [Thraustotheca clavata]
MTPVLQQTSSISDMQELPMAKLFGEREVMAEVKCEFTFAFAGTAVKTPNLPVPKASVLTTEKKSRFNSAFSMLKEQVVKTTTYATTTPTDTSRTSESSSEPLDTNDQPKDLTEYSLPGRLMMTTYRLQFYYHPSMSENDADSMAFQSILRRFKSTRRVHEYCTIPLGTINRVEKIEKNAMLKITTKDHRKFHLVFVDKAFGKVYELLNAYAFPNNPTYLFAFSHRLPKVHQERRRSLEEYTMDDCLPTGEGWNVYDAESEWARLGVLDNEAWRTTDFNKDYAVVDSYPSQLIVPAKITDETLLEAAQFRSIGRIPTLTWLHPVHGASLSRSSQPKVGMGNAFSVLDEELVAAFGEANKSRPMVHIIDCRPMSSAVANRAKGYGVETTLRYKNSVIEFMNIPNIHSMRESNKKLRELSLSLTCNNLYWYSDVEDTKWLHYIRVCLQATLRIIDLIHTQETSVLVHCSHGWDRTSQLCALAQLCMDPYYRTITGFQVLVEKDFLAFGHPFQMRLANGEKPSSEESPIFMQFLDCVWQLQQLYPSYFEFNEGFLCLLADSVHTCRFGTFFLNSIQARENLKLSENTVSIWAWLNGFRNELRNSDFMPDQILQPAQSTLLRSVRVWEHVFLRWGAQTSSLEKPCTTSDLFAANESRSSNWQLSHSILSLLSQQR